MEVALKRRAAEAAAREWYLRPNSGSGVSDRQLVMNANILTQQTSAEPRSCFPSLLTNVLFLSHVSACIACQLESITPQDVALWGRASSFGPYATIDDEQKRALWAAPPAISLLTIASKPVISTIIESLETSLNFTRSQLAQALGVERATLYQWFRGAEPRSKTGERLETLRQFADDWKAARLGSARAAWHFRAAGNKETLGALLTADQIDLQKLRMHIRNAQQSPNSLELVAPKAGKQSIRKGNSAEKRRLREFFPSTYRGDE
jgi:transcriptional regulator with XRE-family HTH domain